MTDKDELEKCFLDRISEPPEDSGGGDHVFSREYERKKQRLIRRASNGCHVPHLRLILAVAAAAVSALIFAGVRVLRMPGFAGVQRHDSTRFSVQPPDGSSDSAEEYYSVDIPEGMRLESMSTVPEIGNYFVWEGGGRMISFSQEKAGVFSPQIDNQHSKYTECTVNGSNAVMVKWDNSTMLMWNIGSSVLMVNTSGFTDDEVMELAEGAQPTERFTLGFDSPGTEYRERPFTLDGFTVTDRSESGGVTETLLAGARDIRVRQCAPEDYVPLMDMDFFEMSRVTLHDSECWLLRWIDEDEYAVVWEQDGCVTEMSIRADPPKVNGAYDISADEESVLSIAGKLMDAVSSENG